MAASHGWFKNSLFGYAASFISFSRRFDSSFFNASVTIDRRDPPVEARSNYTGDAIADL
jgi:hypothetical protein